MNRTGVVKAAGRLAKKLYFTLFVPLLNMHFIIDCKKKLGKFELKNTGYEVDIRKEEIARKYIFNMAGEGLNFLDVGAGEGKLEYLLGIKENLTFDDEFYENNQRLFRKKYNYHCLDIAPRNESPVVIGDICSESFFSDNPQYNAFFDVVYSNNVFEHLKRPWIAAANLVAMLKPNGVCITITPFSLRYHEAPVDYFRYTHAGLTYLFESTGKIQTLISGYDIRGRRNNWQGSGANNDICPVDNFGAWRENWFVTVIVRKIA